MDNMVEQNRGLFIKEENREGCNMFFRSEQGGMQLPFCTKKIAPTIKYACP
jgi:hypothetical protein